MKLLNMLETIFFITLAICCFLLLMLIYHFKQRLSKVEQSNETMFEILNNIIQELSETKKLCAVQYNTYPENIQHKIPVYLSGDDDSLPALQPSYVDESHPVDSDDESDSDSDYESSNDDTSTLSVDKQENIQYNMQSSTDDSVDVKLVNVDVEKHLDYIEETNTEEFDDMNQPDDSVVELNTEDVDSIKINKLEHAENLEQKEEEDKDSNINSMEVYKKMTVPALKALIIEKGLLSDPSKLRKAELIELLEQNIN